MVLNVLSMAVLVPEFSVFLVLLVQTNFGPVRIILYMSKMYWNYRRTWHFNALRRKVRSFRPSTFSTNHKNFRSVKNTELFCDWLKQQQMVEIFRCTGIPADCLTVQKLDVFSLNLIQKFYYFNIINSITNTAIALKRKKFRESI